MAPVTTFSATSHSLHDDTCHPSQWMMIPFTTCSAWRYHSSLALQTWYNDTSSSHALHHDTIPHMHCIMIPYVAHDDSFHCMQCMMKSSNLCIALRNHTTLHCISIHTVQDDTYQLMHCMMIPHHHMRCMTIPTSTSSVWALHDDTIHQMHCKVIPFDQTQCIRTPVLYFSFIAWWHLSSLTVDDDTIHHTHCMTIPLHR
jgi:hypothetical protein